MPVRRRLCSEAASYSPYTGDTCDTELETVCTTILATKYVKVSSLYFRWMDGGVVNMALYIQPYMKYQIYH